MAKSVTRRSFVQGLGASALLTSHRTRSQNGEVDVIVIGAGLAGLYAAYLLEQEGLRVLTVEGRNRVGGRVYTLYDIPGRPEAGGEVFGAYYARCLDVAKRLGLTLRQARPRSSVPDDELFMRVRGQNIRLSDWPDHSLNPHPQTVRSATPWQLFFSELPKDNPLENLDDWTDPRFAEYDIPFYEYLRQKSFNDETIRLLQVNSAYGNTLWDVSTLHIFHYYRWAELQRKGGVRTQIVGGNQRLPEAMRENLKGEVRLDERVANIQTTNDHVVVESVSGRRYRAKRAICTLPFSLTRHLTFDPPLTGIQRRGVETLPYYKTFQIHYAFERPFWEDDGLPPSMWTDGPIGRFNLLRQADSDDPACYLCYVNGLQAANLDRMKLAEAELFVRKTIERLRPAARNNLRPLRVHSNQLDPFIGGSYAYWQPGTPLVLPEAMHVPHGRVHFAGEHTALVNRGMEGAMESGERAALEVLNLI